MRMLIVTGGSVNSPNGGLRLKQDPTFDAHATAASFQEDRFERYFFFKDQVKKALDEWK